MDTPTDPIIYIDGDLAYNLIVLRKMLAILPPNLGTPLLAQHEKIQNCLVNMLGVIAARDQLIKDLVDTQKLNTTYVQFDLEATKRERDDLRRQINGEQP